MDTGGLFLVIIHMQDYKEESLDEGLAVSASALSRLHINIVFTIFQDQRSQSTFRVFNCRVVLIVSNELVNFYVLINTADYRT